MSSPHTPGKKKKKKTNGQEHPRQAETELRVSEAGTIPAELENQDLERP